MNRFKTIWSALMMMSVLLFTISCSNEDSIIDVPPTEDPTEDVTDEIPNDPGLDNQMSIGEEALDFKSCFAMD